jgi:AraC-like DNA-binding protein
MKSLSLPPEKVLSMNYDLTLLNIGFAHHDGDWNFEHICSSFSRIYWVTEGCGEVTFDGKVHRLTPGNLYLIPALVSHSDHCDGVFEHYYIHFMDQSMQIYEHYQQYLFPFEFPVTKADQHIINRLMYLLPDWELHNSDPQSYETQAKTLQGVKLFQSRPLAVQMEINGLLHILFSHFFSMAKPRTTVSDKRIREALWKINKDLANVPSLDVLAGEACMNKDSFIRQFRRQTGSTPTDYIIHRRMMRAQLLFVEGVSSVKEVALQVGYDNISYFGRTFKRITGISPMEFIRQNR